MLSTIPFEDSLNITCKHVAIYGECNEVMGQNQSKPGLAISTGIALDISGTFKGSFKAKLPVSLSYDSVILLQATPVCRCSATMQDIKHTGHLVNSGPSSGTPLQEVFVPRKPPVTWTEDTGDCTDL